MVINHSDKAILILLVARLTFYGQLIGLNFDDRVYLSQACHKYLGNNLICAFVVNKTLLYHDVLRTTNGVSINIVIMQNFSLNNKFSSVLHACYIIQKIIFTLWYDIR